MDRGAWRATVHGVTRSQTRLSDFHTLSSEERELVLWSWPSIGNDALVPGEGGQAAEMGTTPEI